MATRRKGRTASTSKPHVCTGGRTLGIDAGIARSNASDRAFLPSCASAPMMINGKVQSSSTCIERLHSLTDVASDKIRFSSCSSRSPVAVEIFILYHRCNGRPTWHGRGRKLHHACTACAFRPGRRPLPSPCAQRVLSHGILATHVVHPRSSAIHNSRKCPSWAIWRILREEQPRIQSPNLGT